MTASDWTAVARRIDRNHVLETSDGLLGLLTVLGATGLPVAVGMIVDGVVIRGAFGSPRMFATAVDKALASALDAFADSWSQEASETIAGTFSRAVERYETNRDEARELVKRYDAEASEDDGVTIDDVSLADTPAYFSAFADRAAVEVIQARIFVHGEWLDVGSMRVEVSHIAAWWPLEAEADAVVTYSSAEKESE